MSTLAAAARRPLVYRTLTVLAAALLILTAMPTGVAHAHGSTIDPMSRNYGCWKRWGSNFQSPLMATQDPMCWQAWQADTNAMWNWNGLYIDGVGGNYQGAVPDGTLCSGGNTSAGRYAAMDTPGLWVATDVSNNFTLKVHDQARHGADFYRVYVTRQGFNPVTQRLRWADLELVTQTGRILPGAGTTETDPVLNGVTVSIPVSAPNRTGRHLVYTIWQASHSDQSYYLCADVRFPGGPADPSTPPTTSQPPTTTTSTTTSRPPTSTTTSRPPTSTTTTPPGPAGSCTAAYTVLTQWPGGFQGEVRVTAGSAAIRGWRVNWTFHNGQTVGSSWSATMTSSGSAVTATNVSYNGNVAAGASTTFGFLGSWSGENHPATPTCTAL